MKLSRFTLVELIVVIAIIGTLFGLLLPILNKAKEKAKEIKCVNNLKQIGAGAIDYSDIFDDYVIPADLNDIGGYRSWINYMGVELLRKKDVFACPDLDKNECFNPYGGGNIIESASYVMNTIKKSNWGVIANINGDKNNASGWGFDTVIPHKFNQVSKISTKIFIVDFQACDKDFNSSSDARGIVHFEETDHGPLGYGSRLRDVGLHHDSKYNSLMGDMHVENMKLSQDDQWVVLGD